MIHVLRFIFLFIFFVPQPISAQNLEDILGESIEIISTPVVTSFQEVVQNKKTSFKLVIDSKEDQFTLMHDPLTFSGCNLKNDLDRKAAVKFISFYVDLSNQYYDLELEIKNISPKDVFYLKQLMAGFNNIKQISLKHCYCDAEEICRIINIIKTFPDLKILRILDTNWDETCTLYFLYSIIWNDFKNLETIYVDYARIVRYEIHDISALLIQKVLEFLKRKEKREIKAEIGNNLHVGSELNLSLHESEFMPQASEALLWILDKFKTRFKRIKTNLPFSDEMQAKIREVFTGEIKVVL
jgi:hypothetical protein